MKTGRAAKQQVLRFPLVWYLVFSISAMLSIHHNQLHSTVGRATKWSLAAMNLLGKRRNVLKTLFLLLTTRLGRFYNIDVSGLWQDRKPSQTTG